MSKSRKQESILLKEKSFVISLLILFNFGLLIVDHIHFQYNGFLFGIFLLSIVKIFEGKPFHGAFLFSVLLNFKHIFLYVAPAYFVYLLREECFRKDKSALTGISRLLGVRLLHFQPLKLGILSFIVLLVFGMSFGPFLYMGDVMQVLHRLFPVKRGLCHAYWAPNFWALYNTVDKALVLIGNKWKLFAVPFKRASMTGGLVAEQEHVVLPSVSPLVTVVVTVLAMLPFLIQMWYKPRGPKGFLQGLILCGYASFLFGYHVHEKAVLLVLIPLSIQSLFSLEDARIFIIASAAGNFALFPLLHQPAETPVKVVLYIGFHLLVVGALRVIHGWKRSLGIPLVNSLEALYLYGLIVLFAYCNALHSLLGLEKALPFVPLMLTSIYCAIGILWSWVLFYRSALFSWQLVEEQ